MQVIKAPDPKLRIQTKPVKKITPGYLQTFKEMVKLTKTFQDPEGVGLASTQVGLGEQYFVAKVDGSERTRKEVETPARGDSEEGSRRVAARNEMTEDARRDTELAGPRAKNEFIIVINPKITWTSPKTKKYFEGCLSIPNYWGEVKRHLGIKVTYMDETGQTINASLKGVMAWIFQHEIDHLNGILFPDRVLEQKGKFYKFTGRDKTGTDIFEEVTI